MEKKANAFVYAARGIEFAAKTQLNIRLHLVAATAVFILAVIFRISLIESLIVLLTVSVVVVTEMVNTAVESLGDAVSAEKNEYIGRAKDVAAGAVLVSAIFASIVGLVIFVPKIFSL